MPRVWLVPPWQAVKVLPSVRCQAALQALQPVEAEPMSGEGIQEMVLDLFLEADDDESGYLDRAEFKRLLSSAELGLTSRDIEDVMAECDENEDGVIEYREFMPVMVALIVAAQTKEAVEATVAFEDAEAQFEAESFFLRGMSSEDLESLMIKIFKENDADGNGVLDRCERMRCSGRVELAPLTDCPLAVARNSKSA